MNSNDDQPEPGATGDWISRWRHGDAEAFDGLKRRFDPLLRYRIRQSSTWRGLASRYDIEDLLQEVWARMVQGAKHFQNTRPGALAAWLGSIANHALIDLHRRENTMKKGPTPRALESSQLARAHPVPGSGALTTASSEARFVEILRTAHDVLTEREYQAFEWVYVLNYSTAEAGLGLETSDAGVRNLLSRAREKLQPRL